MGRGAALQTGSVNAAPRSERLPRKPILSGRMPDTDNVQGAASAAIASDGPVVGRFQPRFRPRRKRNPELALRGGLEDPGARLTATEPELDWHDAHRLHRLAVAQCGTEAPVALHVADRFAVEHGMAAALFDADLQRAAVGVDQDPQ